MRLGDEPDVPPIVEGAVVRPRLLAAMERRWHVPLVILEAGAGFGKTTLLGQAVAENRLSPKGQDVFVSLDVGHSSAPALIGAILSHVDRSLGGPSDPVLEELIDVLSARSPGHVSVILDDAHRLDAGSTGERLINDLLRRLPANVHLVVSSRRSPALDSARLEASRSLVRIDEGDLRFSSDETERVTRHHAADLEQLDAYDGWPALVDLAARIGVSTAEDFVWQEILNSQTPAVRDVLVVAALLDGHHPEVIDSIGGVPGAAAKLESVPLVDVMSDGQLRPHHLWREILGVDDPGVDERILQRAGAALGQRGEYDRQYELLAHAGSWEEALPALFQACSDQHNPPYRDQMARWSELIPDNLRERPEARYVEGMIARSDKPWAPDTMSLLLEAIDGFTQRGDRRSTIVAGLRTMFVPYARCDAEGLRRILARLVQVDESDPHFEERIARTPATAALLRFLDGDYEAAREVLNKVDLDEVETRMRFFIPMMEGSISLTEGWPGDAEMAFELASTFAAECDQAAGTLDAQVRGPLARFLGGDLSVAVNDTLPTDTGRYTIGEQLETAAWRALLAVHVGRREEAVELLDAVGDAEFAPLDLPRVTSVVALTRAGIAAADADDDTARRELSVCFGRGVMPSAETGALLWQPATPAALSEELEEALSVHIHGPEGKLALALGSTLRQLRRGKPWPGPNISLDPHTVLCRLPLELALEVACWAMAHNDQRASAVIDEAIAAAPGPTRAILRSLTDRLPSAVAKRLRAELARLPIPPAAAVSIGVLGPMTLLRGGDHVVDADWRRGRVRALLSLLVHHRVIARERAAALLWPDSPPDRALSNLRLTLHYLLRCLEPDRGKGDASYFVHQEASMLRLDGADLMEVDAWRFERFLNEADEARRAGAVSLALDKLQDGLALWRGPYFDELVDQPWVEIEQERLRLRFVQGAVTAGGLQLAAGRLEDAASTAYRALEVEPWSEEAHRVLISSHIARGDRAAALRAVEATHDMLDELGLEPHSETIMLERLAKDTGSTETARPD